MQKVLEMAEGISVGEMRSYELVPSAEAKKRPRLSEGSKCIKISGVLSVHLCLSVDMCYTIVIRF